MKMAMLKADVRNFFGSLCRRDIKNNLQHYYLYYFASGFLFEIPIWVMFYRRIVDFPQIAFFTVMQALVTTALEIPSGALADIIGRRKTVLIGLALVSTGYIGIALSSTFHQLLIFQIILGVAGALISGADSAILYDSLKQTGREDDFSKVVVKNGFLYRIGLITGSFTGGFLYKLWIPLPYVMIAISMAIAAFWMFFTVEPSIDSEKFSLKNYIKQTRSGVKEITKSQYMKKLTAYYVLVGAITWSCLYYFNQPFALDFGFNEIEMSIIFGFIYLFTTIILYVLTTIPNLLTRERVYLGFPILMMVCFLPGYFIPKLAAPLLILGIQVAGSGRFSILDKYTNKEFEPKNRATANSTLNMIVQILMVVLIQSGGYIQGIYNTRIIYTFLGVITLTFIMPFAVELLKDHRAYIKNGIK